MSTLVFVARTKKLDRKYVEHVAGILRPILNGPRFKGNVTAMAKDLKVSQPQLQALMTGGERGIGIMFLLAVREYLPGQTLDSLLGLEPPEFVQMTRIEKAIERGLAQRLLPPAPPRDEVPPPSREESRLQRRRRSS